MSSIKDAGLCSGCMKETNRLFGCDACGGEVCRECITFLSFGNICDSCMLNSWDEIDQGDDWDD